MLIKLKVYLTFKQFFYGKKLKIKLKVKVKVKWLH